MHRTLYVPAGHVRDGGCYTPIGCHYCLLATTITNTTIFIIITTITIIVISISIIDIDIGVAVLPKEL